MCVYIYQFSSATQWCPTLCNPMDCSTPGLLVHHQLPEFTQTQVHWVSDAIQPSHPLLSPSPPAFEIYTHTHTHTHTHTFYVFITLKYYLDHILWHYPFNNHSSIGSSSSYACLSCLWFHLDSSFVILSSSFPGFLVSFPHTTLLIND